jgi:hypothetical protein
MSFASNNNPFTNASAGFSCNTNNNTNNTNNTNNPFRTIGTNLSEKPYEPKWDATSNIKLDIS